MRIATFVIAGFVLAAAVVCAQPGEQSAYAVAELVTDAGDFTKPFTVGIRFVIDPGWYLYWKNPGDAGLPVEVTWKLPAGWTASLLEFPTPSKFVYEDVIAYGYKNEIVFFTAITPVPGTVANSIAASLDWLVCKESCVREKAEVPLTLQRQSESGQKAAAGLLTRFRQLLPIPEDRSGILTSRVAVKIDRNAAMVSVTLAGEKSNDIIDFFPEVSTDFQIEFSSIRVSDGILSFRGIPLRDNKRFVLRGLFVTKDHSFECSIPIDLSAS